MSSRASRRQKEQEAQDQAPEQQNKNLAFNTFGWAITVPDGINKDSVTVINAYEISSTFWNKAISMIKGKGENPYRSSLDLTEREKSVDEAEANVSRYLLVGFTYESLDADHHKMHPDQKKQTPVGTQRGKCRLVNFNKPLNSNEQPDRIGAADSDLPIMVVAQLEDAEVDSVKLYALLGPKSHLCRPYQVGQKDVFYLSMFRDHCTQFKLRGPAWNKLVQQHRIRNDIQGHLSAKQLAFQRARNTSKVVLDPVRSLQNEVLTLVAGYVQSEDIWHLQELLLVLEGADADLVYQPQPSNNAMRKFVDNEEDDWLDSDSRDMLAEFSEQWPDIKEIPNADDITSIKRQLLDRHVLIEYRLLRPFIAETAHIFKAIKAGKIAMDNQAVAQTALDNVTRILGTKESAAPIPTDSDNLLLLALKSAMDNMVTTSRKFDDELKSSAGDVATAETPQDIWEKFANQLDTDAAKLMWMANQRYTTACYNYKHHGIGHMVEELAQVFEHLKIKTDDSIDS